MGVCNTYMNTASVAEDMADDTTIRVSEELADELYRRKGRGTSYEEFLWILLEQIDELDQQTEPEVELEQRDRVDRNESDDVDSSRSLEERVDDRLEEIDITGRGHETQEVRREAVKHAWSLLRKRGDATTQELANASFDEYKDQPKFGYSASGTRYRGYQWWDGCARDVLKQLPGVEPPPQRGNTWSFSGDAE